MPNHVSHKMVFLNEACAPLIMQMKMGVRPNHEWFDFHHIIPEPEHVGEGWYEWRIANWGTKWGAYSIQEVAGEKHFTVRFDTAWSTAEPVWEAIAEQYPEADIEIYYADEDTGANLGFIHIENGEVDVNEFSDEPPESQLTILNEVYGDGTYEICQRCGGFVYNEEECYNCEEEGE